MHTRHSLLACGCALSLLSAPACADERCDGERVLSEAAHAYRRLASFSDIARYAIRVPGAPEKSEVTEYGFDREVRGFIRMPGLYVVVVDADRLHLTVDPHAATARVLEHPAGAELQASIDAAFEGHGSPLVPVPLLLRAAADPQSLAQAFSTRLLSGLHVAGCRRLSAGATGGVDEVSLDADNGAIRAQFDARSRLLARYHAEITTGRGSPPVTAEVTFEPRPGMPPSRPRLSGYAGLQQVRRFDDLTGERTDAPADAIREIALQSVDGQPVVIRPIPGGLTILEFWARWCAPCRFTLPAVERLATWARHAQLPVQVVLVNTADDFESVSAARSEVERFLRWAEVALPTTLDLDGSVLRRFGGGLPLTIVISGDGRMVGRHGGFDAQLEDKLRTQVQELLGPHTAAPAADAPAALAPMAGQPH